MISHITGEEVEKLLKAGEYTNIVRFAQSRGVLRLEGNRARLLPPSFLMSREHVSLGKLYGYLLDQAERRLCVEVGNEGIQRFSEARVREELDIVKILFQWPEFYQQEFMIGVEAFSKAYRNLLYTKSQLWRVLFLRPK